MNYFLIQASTGKEMFTFKESSIKKFKVGQIKAFQNGLNKFSK